MFVSVDLSHSWFWVPCRYTLSRLRKYQNGASLAMYPLVGFASQALSWAAFWSPGKSYSEGQGVGIGLDQAPGLILACWSFLLSILASQGLLGSILACQGFLGSRGLWGILALPTYEPFDSSRPLPHKYGFLSRAP